MPHPRSYPGARSRSAHPLRLVGASLLMGLFALLGSGGVIWVHQFTEDRIQGNQRQDSLSAIHKLLPEQSYDNDPLAQPHAFSILRQGRPPLPATAYALRRGTLPVATLVRLTTPDGYNGDIELMLAVRHDGSLSGVEVVAHRETPGLGDRIESRRSDWLSQFDGVSLENPSDPGWKVKRDGGGFDQLTGATVTPRAVVSAVHEVLAYLQRNPPLFDSGQSTAGVPQSGVPAIAASCATALAGIRQGADRARCRPVTGGVIVGGLAQ